jgi:L-lactate utilization protein LutB
MAFVVLGGIALAAGSYALAKVGELFGEVADKIAEPFVELQEDKEEREKEEKRQEQINRTQKLHETHDKIREQYKLKKSNYMKLMNDTTFVCDVIYVAKYNASNKKEAIRWAKDIVNKDYLKSGMLNKLQTKKVVVEKATSIELVDNEFNEYFIVLHVNERFMIVDKTNLDNGTIYVKGTFAL